MLYIWLNGATLVTDVSQEFSPTFLGDDGPLQKNARKEELRQKCTKENNDFCKENEDLAAALTAATVAAAISEMVSPHPRLFLRDMLN